jgi:hypothetical protein
MLLRVSRTLFQKGSQVASKRAYGQIDCLKLTEMTQNMSIKNGICSFFAN